MKKIIAFAMVILMIFGFVFTNTTTVSSMFEESGYVMPVNTIESDLSSDETRSLDDIQMLSVEERDEILESRGTFYDSHNHELDLKYPMIVRDDSAIRFLDGGTYFVDTDFQFLQSADNMIISDLMSFDRDGHVVDENHLIFAQLKNGMNISTIDLTIHTRIKDYQFNRFSIFYFDEEWINVYTYEKEGKYSFEAVRGLQNATVTFDGKTMSYVDFYKKLLQVIERIEKEREEEEVKVEEIIEEIEEVKKEVVEVEETETVVVPEELPVVDEEPATEEPVEEPSEPEENPLPSLPRYVKPEVTVSDIQTWVYTINGNIKIYDPTSRINRGVYFYVYDENGKLILRQIVKSSGMLNLSVLPPDSYLAVEAKYQYYNEQSKQIEEVCLERTIVKTLPIEGNVQAINLSYKHSAVSYDQSMMLENMILKNTSDYQENVETYDNFIKNTLPYVYNVYMSFIGEDNVLIGTSISSSQLSKMKLGQAITFKTKNLLESNKTYKYYIYACDRFGNVIPFDEKIEGVYTTAKATPTVKIKVTKNDTNYFAFSLGLEDKDGTMDSAEDYKLSILNDNGELLPLEYELNGSVGSGNTISLPATSAKQNIVITNLPYSTKLTLQANGSYDLNNGEGKKENQLLGTYQVFTASIPNGSITYSDQFTDISGTFGTMHLSLSQSSTGQLIELLTKTTVHIETTGHEQDFVLTKEMFDAVDVNQNYDDSLQALLIQSKDIATKTPEIYLYASKETIQNQGAWKTFMNSGLYGVTNDLAGQLTVKFAEGTLKTSSVYNVSMSSTASVNGKDYDIQTFITTDKFYTLSKEPTIYYDDYFIAQNFIEIFDIDAIDHDHVIVDGKYVMQILEVNASNNEEMLDSENLVVGQRKDNVRFDCLEKGKSYIIRFIAPQYNQTTDESTLKEYVTLSEFRFKHSDGLQANISLVNMNNTYGSAEFNDSFVKTVKSEGGEGIQYHKTFDAMNKNQKLIDNDAYFVTDYLPYTPGKTSIFRDFGPNGKYLRIVYYNSSKVYLGNINPNRAHFYSIDECNYNSLLTNQNIAYIRIVGFMGYEDSAQYFQIDDSNLENMLSVHVSGQTDKNKDLLIPEVQPHTTGYDSKNTTLTSTPYMECNPGELLIVKYKRDDKVSYNKSLYFYTEDHKYINSYSYGANDQSVFKVPERAAYVRLALTYFDENTCSVTFDRIVGTTVASYVGKINWTMEDSSQDNFTLKDVIGDNKYIVTKKSANGKDASSFDKTEYIHDYSLSSEFEDDGSLKLSKVVNEPLVANKTYYYELSIEYHGKKIILDSCQFNTDCKTFILSTADDLIRINAEPFANYIAVNDIVESSTNYLNNYNGTTPFGGVIDFQGYSLTLEAPSNWFLGNISNSGVIKNINVIQHKSISRGFIQYNYGLVQNITYTVDMDEGATLRQPLIYYNTLEGTIENFVVKIVDDCLLYQAKHNDHKGLFVTHNSNVIRNGYMYSTKENGAVYITTSRTNTGAYNYGVLTAVNNVSGKVSEVYTTLDIYVDYDKREGNYNYGMGLFSGNNAGRFSNCFAVSSRYKFVYDTNENEVRHLGECRFEDPLFGSSSGVYDSNSDYKYVNIYLNSKGQTNYNPKYVYSKAFEYASLYDSAWYKQNIQSTNQFEVESMVSQGYYPMVKDTYGKLLTGQTYNPLPGFTSTAAPELLETLIDQTTPQYVDVVLKFTNKSLSTITSVTVQDINSVAILEQYMDDSGVYIVKVRLSEPVTYVSNYTLTQFSYRRVTTVSTVTCSKNIEASFYKEINNLDDWKLINQKQSWNYRLNNNIDFASLANQSWPSNIHVNNFYGKLDGGDYDQQGNLIGNYSISNITVSKKWNSILFTYVKGGEIKNIDFINIKMDNSNSDTSNGGIIYQLQYETVDNVHIRNIDINSRNTIGALAAYSYSSTIQNCSVTNATLVTNYGENIDTRVGGMVGYTDNTYFRNSFVSNFNISTKEPDMSKSLGAGGFVGYTNNRSRFENCYAVGNIKNASYNGGIAGVGNLMIRNCYTNVYIEADGDYNGGLAAGLNTDQVIENSLSIGSIVSGVTEPLYTHRIGALSNYWYVNNVYGYTNQYYNSQDMGIDDASGIVNYQDLSKESTYTDKIRLGNAYQYNEVSLGNLPKLLNTDGTALLPYQRNEGIMAETVKMYVESAIHNGSNYQTNISIEHPNYNVDEVVIDGMYINSIVKNEGEDVSKYQIQSSKIASLDNYRVRATLSYKDDPTVKYVLTGVANYQSESTNWIIRDVVEWQNTMEQYGQSNENFIIDGTIDFSNYGGTGQVVVDPILNLKINKMVGTNNAVIKNLTIKGGDFCLINTVFTDISNITFKNITIEIDGNYSRSVLGIIAVNQGTAKNLKFENCTIRGVGSETEPVKFNADSYVGMIAKVYNVVEDCELDDIKIYAKGVNGNNPYLRSVRIGGLCGYALQSVQRVTAKNVTIDAENGQYVGGVIGVAERNASAISSIENIHVYNMNIKGSRYVGGIFGYINNVPMYNFTGEKIRVNNHSSTNSTNAGLQLGGIGGLTYISLNNKEISNYSFKDIEVNGKYYVGGLFGDGREVSYVKATNIKVNGISCVGGITGLSPYGAMNYVTLDHATVIASQDIAGGLVGTGGYLRNSQVIDSNVTANNYVGGFSGTITAFNVLESTFSSNYSLDTYNSALINTTVIANNSHAAGFIGYGNNSGGQIYRSFVKGSTITAGSGGYAAGLITETIASNFYHDYVDSTTITSTGDYVGGFIGKADFTNTGSTGKIYRNYTTNTVQVSGRDYVGGAFGYYNSKNSSSSSNNRNLYSLINSAAVNGTGSHVYKIGYISDNSINTNYYYGALVYYGDNATLTSNATELSNYSDSKIYTIDKKDLTSYTKLVGTLANDGLSMDKNYTNNLNLTGIQLESFAISQTGTSGYINNVYQYPFHLSGIGRDNAYYSGQYKLDVYRNSKSDANKLFSDLDLSITNGAADITLQNKYLYHNMLLFVIKDSNGNIVGESKINYIKNETFIPLKTSDNQQYYQYSGDKNAITLTINGSGTTYRWYHCWYGQSYNSNASYGSELVEVTALANGNTLTTNVPGVYFATVDGHYTEMFTYETLVYYPQISTSANANLFYQDGYTINSTTENNYVIEGTTSTLKDIFSDVYQTSQNSSNDSYLEGSGVSSLYNKNMNYQGAIPLGMVYKKDSSDGTVIRPVELPTYDIYASGVDTINVEFGENVPMTTDTDYNYYIAVKVGNESHDVKITGRVMTFTYNFTDDITITLSYKVDGTMTSSNTKTYSANSLAQKLSLSGASNYYYISDEGKLYSNGNVVAGTYVHVYGDEVLNSNHVKRRIDGTGSQIPISSVGVKVDNTVPLGTAVIDGQTVTYYKHFMVKENGDINNEMLISKGNSIIAFDGSANRLGTGIIVGSVTENSSEESNTETTTEYLAYLNTNKYITDLKGTFTNILPSGFNNNNIVEISSHLNVSNDNHYVMVRYGTGDIIVFDYTNGTEIHRYTPPVSTLTASLFSYARSFMRNMSAYFSPSNQAVAYAESQEMINELNAISDEELMEMHAFVKKIEVNQLEDEDNQEIQEDIKEDASIDISDDSQDDTTQIEVDEGIVEEIQENVTNTPKVSRNYVTMYNEKKRQYEIYTVESIMTTSTKELKSENEVVKKAVDNGFEISKKSILTQSARRIENQNSYGFIAMGGILIVIGGLLVVLYRKNKDNA